MRIGVEARKTSGCGIGRVTQLVCSWLQSSPKHPEVLAFGPPWVTSSLPSDVQHVDWRAIPFSEEDVHELPQLVDKLHVDLFISLQFHTSPYVRCRQIRFIHDLWPLSHPELRPSWAELQRHFGVMQMEGMLEHFGGGLADTTEGTDPLSRLLEGICVRGLRNADAVVTVSHTVEAHLARRFPFLADKLYVVYPIPPTATMLSQSRPRSTFALANAPGPPYALHVGNWEPRKNQQVLLEAVDRARRELDCDLRLTMVGDLVGSYRRYAADLREAIGRAGSAGWLQHLGKPGDATLSELYRGARLVVQPSLDEGFGLPALEAMWLGAPVVAAKAGALPEVCGTAASYADPEDPRSIARAIADCWTDDELRRRMSDSGRERARSLLAQGPYMRDQFLAMVDDVLRRSAIAGSVRAQHEESCPAGKKAGSSGLEGELTAAETRGPSSFPAMRGRRGDAPDVVVVGAGPAGLTAAWRLAERGAPPTVLEADEEVGGLSRTWRHDGFLVDAGGHRFFTKVKEVEAIWRELLDERDLLRRKRSSGFLVRGNYHAYPLDPWEVIRRLRPVEALECLASLGWARLRPTARRDNFEQWAWSHFGRRLYTMLYKPYTEKLWGLPAREISADWAAQRIKVPAGPLKLLLTALGLSGPPCQSLASEFWYPRLGPGMLWEEMCSRVQVRGSKVLRGTRVARIHHDAGRVVAVTAECQGTGTVYDGDHFISSMPLSALVPALDPPAPADVRQAAQSLRHRNLLVVALVVPGDVGFDYQWIYVPSPMTRVGRIQNYRNWSPEMVWEGHNTLGMEYFLADTDPLWCLADEELIQLASDELGMLDIARPADVQQGFVIRVPMAYPVLDQWYKENVAQIRSWLQAHAANLHPIGRNGMHKYNNQDHSMLTAMLAVDNIFGADHDVWTVNTRADYHEEQSAPSRRG